MLVSLLAYMGVGIFEEIIRAYQIRNITEGLAGSRLGASGAMIVGVILAGLWSVVMHTASQDASFLMYVMFTAVIYGFFYIWTGRVALAMAMHFAWDFTNSSIFQVGSMTEPSIFTMKMTGTPLWYSRMLPAFHFHDMVGMIAKGLGLVIVVLWIVDREHKIRAKEEIAIPKLISQERE